MVPLLFGVPGGVELLVILLIALIGLVVPLVLAYWVYNDASARGDDNAAIWAIVAGLATATTLVGGPIVVAVYIWQRGDGPPRTEARAT